MTLPCRVQEKPQLSLGLTKGLGPMVIHGHTEDRATWTTALWDTTSKSLHGTLQGKPSASTNRIFQDKKDE